MSPKYNRSFLSDIRCNMSVVLPTLLTLVGAISLLPVTSSVARAGDACGLNSAVPGLRLVSLTVSPSVVESRSEPKGEVVLSAPAPEGGATVILGTSFHAANPGYCLVVPEGKTSETFSIFTYDESTTTSGHIFANYNGSFFAKPLTVTPKN